MKTPGPSLALAALVLAFILHTSCFIPSAAAQPTAFTYQGFLTENGAPASGASDFEFKLYNDPSAGTQQGSTVTLGDVGVTNGLFTVSLDFTASPFTGQALWLDIAVRPGASAGAYTNLLPRQPITATPYAIKAANAMTVDMGTISNPNFIGTTTTSPLEFFVNNQRALRLEPPTAGSVPNLVGGFSGNTVGAGTEGAVIAGGGSSGGNENVIGVNADYSAIVGGRSNNISTNAQYATIAGGGENYLGVNTDYSAIGGGQNNNIAANSSSATIAGGGFNDIGMNADHSAIGGGGFNGIASDSWYATIAGGLDNDIGVNATWSTIGGGRYNNVANNAQHAVIPGGYLNAVGAGANNAFAAGYRAQANQPGTFVWADSTDADFASTASNQFLIRASGGVGIGTGAPQGDLHIRGSGTNGSMVLTPNVSDSQSQILLAENQSATLGMILRYAGNEGGNPLHIIPLNAGGVEGAPQFTLERFGGNVGIGTNNPVEKLHVIGNILATGTVQAQNLSVSGGALTLGGATTQSLEFEVNGIPALRLEFPTGVGTVPNLIGGSTNNSIGNATQGSVILGGGSAANPNLIGTNVSSSTIAGGSGNQIYSGLSTIAGGANNIIREGAPYGAIGGGNNNEIGRDSYYTTIAGGIGNDVGTNSGYSFVGGGNNNDIADATLWAVIAGGSANNIGRSSSYSAIGGGNNNSIASNSPYATIPGGTLNFATNSAFAAGRRAKANHTGAFVWGDSTVADVVSTNADSVTFRASGGVRFFSSIDTTAPAPGVALAPGASSWGTISDRNAKKNFVPVDGLEVLEQLTRMPIQRWNYKAEPDDAVPHIGPMAQDFKAAFYPGRDDKTITTMEFDGVALAAIQGLNQKVEEQRAENAELKRELGEIKTLLKKLAR